MSSISSLQSVASMLQEFPFLQTETRKEGESNIGFIKRRLFEEFDFFASLKEAPKTQLEVTNKARKVTRWFQDLPNNYFCVSGVFGIQSTATLSRTLSQAQEDRTFETNLMTHLHFLNTCVRVLLNDQTELNTEDKVELYGKLYNCSKGVTAYNAEHKTNETLHHSIGRCIILFNETLQAPVKILEEQLKN